jgi:hypothetical protein
MYQADARPSCGRTMAEATRGFLEEDVGEADSAKSEMMVASSVQLILRERCGFVI